jgi:hypothetical protein
MRCIDIDLVVDASTSAGSSHMVGYYTDIIKPGAAPRLCGAGLYSQHFPVRLPWPSNIFRCEMLELVSPVPLRAAAAQLRTNKVPRKGGGV